MSQPDLMSVRERVTTQLHPQETATIAEVSALARATDPAMQTKQTPAGPQVGDLGWVPALDVLRGQGHRLADWHAATQERIVRRIRHSAGQAATAPFRAVKQVVTQQTASLPPLASFGQTPIVAPGQVVSA